MAKLVFQGHETRGKELHKLLENLGGLGTRLTGCNCITCYYYINQEGYIEGSNKIPAYMIYRIITTLEEFESKYPYKVGDKVIDMDGLHGTITTMSWDEYNCTVRYTFKDDEVGTNHHGYTALMLTPDKEKLIKQPMLTPTLDSNTGEIVYFTDKTTNKIYYPNEPSDLLMECPDGFEFIDENGNVIPVKKIKLERKKPQYPKTYIECAKILNCFCSVDIDGYKNELLEKLQELLTCRDAYWKIAGDWKPDVMYCDLYCIGYDGNVITWKMQGGCRLLVFPTEEMRDAFYENFKDLIEFCKELL